MEDDEDAAQAARNRALYAMRDPHKFAPWEEQEPNGWRLDRAVYALTLPEWRDKVRNLLADMDVGLTPERWLSARDNLWEHIHWRLRQGQLIARGRLNGTDLAAPEVIELDLLDNATPDFNANTLTCNVTLFRSIRIYQAESTPKESVGTAIVTGSSKSSGGPEPRHGDGFIQEMLRFALTPDGFETRRHLQEHMEDWCSRTMGDDSPSARSIERWVKRYCPSELPTK